MTNHRIRYNDKEYTIKPIVRYVAEGAAVTVDELDEDGFGRRGFLLAPHKLYSTSVLMRDCPGGIIEGEGDVGKSWFVDMLKEEQSQSIGVQVVSLREYGCQLKELLDIASAFWQQNENTSNPKALNLIFDGLDEAEEAGPIIKRICDTRKNKERCRVWITSRSCAALDRLINEQIIPTRYHLVPFSERDINAFAANVGADGNEFVELLKRKGVSSFAAKPGIIKYILMMYGRGELKSLSRMDLMRKLTESLALDMREGEYDRSNKSGLSVGRMVEIASWISFQMLLNNKFQLWNGSELDCPDNALPLATMDKGIYKFSEIQEATKHRLFEPVGFHRLRLSCDADTQPYLAALWVHKFVQGEKLKANLFRLDVALGEPTLQMFKWLCVLEPNLGRYFIAQSPHHFLECSAAIEQLGATEYLKLLLADLESIPVADARRFITNAGAMLADCRVLGEAAIACLGRAETPIEDALFCAQLLVYLKEDSSRAFDATTHYFDAHWEQMTLDRRRGLISMLAKMPHQEPCRELHTIKERLLNLNCQDAHDEEMIAEFLFIVGREHLSTQELASCLTKPHESVHTYYGFYLTTDFWEQFKPLFTKDNILPVLERVATFCDSPDSERHSNEFFRQMFCFAWQWADDPQIAKVLADYIFRHAGITMEGFFDLPNCDKRAGSPVRPLSANEVLADQSKRLAILDAMLDYAGDTHRIFKSLLFANSGMKLCTPDEFPTLFQKWEFLTATGKVEPAHRLAIVLEQLSNAIPETEFHTERTELFAAEPELKGFDLEALHKNIVWRDNFIASQELKRTKREEAENTRRQQHRVGFQKFILTTEMNASLYVRLTQFMSSELGAAAVPDFDITSGCQWKNLGDEARKRVVEAAWLFLTEFTTNTIAYVDGNAMVSALYYLWRIDRTRIRDIPGERWEKITEYCLCAASLHTNEHRQLDRMLDWAYARYPTDCERGALKAICEELKVSNWTMPIHLWGKRMSDDVLAEVLRQFPDKPETHGKQYEILKELVWSHVRLPGLKRYFDGRYHVSDPFKSGVDDYFVFALNLYPYDYEDVLIDLCENHADLFRTWVESFKESGPSNHLESALSGISTLGIARIFVQLMQLYPDGLRIACEGDGLVKPGQELHFVILHLQNKLMADPSRTIIDLLRAGSPGNEDIVSMISRMAKVLIVYVPPVLKQPGLIQQIIAENRPVSSMTVREARNAMSQGAASDSMVDPAIVNPTSLMTTSPDQIPVQFNNLPVDRQLSLMMGAATLQGLARLNIGVAQVGAGVDDANRILNRVDNRSRKRAERHEEKMRRDEVDLQAWQIWSSYEQGKYEPPQNTHKRAYEDLLQITRTRNLLADLGITTVKALKDAIRRENRRIKENNAKSAGE